MPSRALNHTRSSDAEIFFTSVFAVASVLIAGELLFRVLLLAGDAQPGPALLARTAPLSSVRPLYAFFVLLPTGLAFLAIGLPFCLRTVSAAVRGKLVGRERQAFLGVGACVAAAVIEVNVGGSGIFSVLAAAAIAARQSRDAITRFGEDHGFSLLAVSGAWLAGLAWYETRAIGTTDPSIAVAPTFLVASLIFAVAGLLATTAAATARRGQGRVVVALSWLAVLAWLGTPLLRSRLASSAAAADRIEIACTVVAAVVLTLSGLLQRLRG